MEPSPTSICKMDYCGTNKDDSMCRKERWGSCFRRNVMMDRSRAMVVQSAPQHSLRSHTIGPIWKMMWKSMWRLIWFVNKIKHLTRNKWACYNVYQFRKGRGKVCPWISWWACLHQAVLMPSWWWWINLARWHISFPQRMRPRPKRRKGCSSHTCSNIMVFQRT